MKIPDGFVRPAVVGDLAIIEGWLPDPSIVSDTLSMNWEITRRQFERGRLLVWEDRASGQPIAYFWGTLDSTNSVVEVHPEHRRRGVARAIVAYLIDDALASDRPLLEIDCPTDSAIQFWREMGFQVDETHCGPFLGHRGRRILTPIQQLPVGPTVAVTVRFLPEEAAFEDAIFLPFVEWSGFGVRTSPAMVVLPIQVAAFDLEDGQNLAVELVLAGRCIHRGLAKYGAKYGVRRCENGFVIGAMIHEPERAA
jgi:GNAT superfamily N-acetyltransferase